MKKLTYFVGGSVGSEPYSPRTWSGSSHFLLKEMGAAGLLDKAIGLDIPKPLKAFLMTRNFNRNRPLWRKQFYMDIAFRDALTRVAGKVPVESPICMQVGSMFCLPTVFKNKQCISYNDGNLAMSLESGFGLHGLSRARIDRALRYEEETSQQMSAVFTFSEYMCESFIRDYRVPAARVFNVGGAVNLSEIPEALSDKDYSVPSILFVGVDFVRKGGPQLLEAFRILRESLPSAQLHIVGPAHLDNLPAGAICHGHLSKDDPSQKQHLEQLFRTCTLFTLPSLYEPFGIAPLEAMLYRLPAVVTNAWALRECVTPAVNGDLVEKGSVEDLAAKLLRLLENPGELKLMGQRGRELVLSRFTWPAVVQRISAAIESLG